jgi:Sensors of blue-light using FAD
MYELMYYSTAKQHINEEDIANILNTARDFNLKSGITGCLLFHNNDFIQLLEGDKELIKELFAKIQKDNRHSNVNLLAEGEKKDRVFENWSMAYHKLDLADTANIERFLFIKNFLALSDLTAKPTEAINLFFYLAQHLLKE